MLLIHLACQIPYLYAYAPALKQRSFAERMKYEHRQFHLDVLARMETGTIPFRRHQRAIRDHYYRANMNYGNVRHLTIMKNFLIQGEWECPDEEAACSYLLEDTVHEIDHQPRRRNCLISLGFQDGQ